MNFIELSKMGFQSMWQYWRFLVFKHLSLIKGGGAYLPRGGGGGEGLNRAFTVLSGSQVALFKKPSIMDNISVQLVMQHYMNSISSYKSPLHSSTMYRSILAIALNYIAQNLLNIGHEFYFWNSPLHFMQNHYCWLRHNRLP